MTRPRHLEVLRCPSCHGQLSWEPDDNLQCQGRCRRSYPRVDGLYDFAPDIPRGSGGTRGQWTMEKPTMVARYQSMRTRFVRWMGRTGGTEFDVSAEYDYLSSFVEPVNDGVILDLACGTGLALQHLADLFGEQRVIGLDISFAMLAVAGEKSPTGTLLRGSALQLPFADNSIGAVTCWDALQALPDPQTAISEVGRCLQPGGTFSCFTFEKATGPYRLLHSAVAALGGSKLYTFEEMTSMVETADMSIVDRSGPGHVLLYTARKEPAPG